MSKSTIALQPSAVVYQNKGVKLELAKALRSKADPTLRHINRQEFCGIDMNICPFLMGSDGEWLAKLLSEDKRWALHSN